VLSSRPKDFDAGLVVGRARLVGRERRGCLFEVPSANRTEPGRMAGLRCFRVMPLPEAHGAIVLSVGRLLPQRLRLSRRVWDAGE
jgi:hypothetical protein